MIRLTGNVISHCYWTGKKRLALKIKDVIQSAKTKVQNHNVNKIIFDVKTVTETQIVLLPLQMWRALVMVLKVEVI